MAANPSFDIVSKVDRQEVDNAFQQAEKELGTRFDFRGTGAEIAKWAGEEAVTITAETEERVKAALDVFKEKLVKRNISLKSLDAGEPRAVRQDVQDRLQDRPGHRVGQGQGDQQEDPRRGPEGRPGADPGRPAAGHRQEEGRPAGRDRPAQAGGLRRRAAVHELPVAAGGGDRRRSDMSCRCAGRVAVDHRGPQVLLRADAVGLGEVGADLGVDLGRGRQSEDVHDVARRVGLDPADFNVFPNEIEDVLATHAGVLECAVIGVEESKSGEAVKAFIVKKDPNLTAEEVIKYCGTQLTGYKVPKQVEFRTELPKTNVGKILRRELRDEKKKAAAA